MTTTLASAGDGLNHPGRWADGAIPSSSRRDSSRREIDFSRWYGNCPSDGQAEAELGHSTKTRTAQRGRSMLWILAAVLGGIIAMFVLLTAAAIFWMKQLL
jgi:hypothetical protein